MNKIPLNGEPQEYNFTAFTDEPMVQIVSRGRIIVDMQYPRLGMKNAFAHCFLRKEVAKRLVIASENLPKGYCLKIWDAWRPFRLQEELYKKYRSEIIKTYLLNEEDPNTDRLVSKFVSKPNYEIENPPVHTTGGAIDLTIIDESGKELDMGTGFDSFSDSTHTCFFENSDSVVRDNRRLLYEVMINAGFTNLPSEWWHYDYGDKFWAYYKQEKTIYKGVFEERFLWRIKRK